jgi:hypothetical protein
LIGEPLATALVREYPVERMHPTFASVRWLGRVRA